MMKSTQKTTPFAEYWKNRGINPAIIPAEIKGDYHQYWTQVNGHPERFQWGKSVPFDMNGIQYAPFTRLSFSKKKQIDIPLFVSPDCDYATTATVYVTEGLPDCFSLLTNGAPAIALKSKGALRLATSALCEFLHKFPNVTQFCIIPDPDGWQDWTREFWGLDLSVDLVFVDIRQALETAGITGKDVNDLWRGLLDKQRFMDALHGAVVTVNRPNPEPAKPKPQPAKRQTTADRNLDAILADLDAWYTSERMADYGLAHAPHPSKGLQPVGTEIEIQSNGGFYVHTDTRAWRIYGRNAGGIGIVTLASYLMHGANSVHGEQFSAMLKEIAAFAGYALPEPNHAERPPHPADVATSRQGEPKEAKGMACKQCGTVFAPTKKDRKFCSWECFQEWQKQQKQQTVGKAAEIAEFLANNHVFAFNELEDRPYVDGQQLTDAIEAQLHVQCVNAGFSGRRLISDIITTECRKVSYHPIKDYFEALKYDGKPHIKRLSAYVKDKHGLFDVVLRKWMIQAVSKVFAGTQNEVLVLVGGQGIGKSLLVRWLCPEALREYFVECGQIDPHDKDAQIMHASNFFGEVGELGSTTKNKEVRALKDFFTKGHVTVRVPYATYSVKRQTCMSFIGTENEDGAGFLRDTTGNRRYIPVDIVLIDWTYRTACNIDQMWAEAYAAYTRGEKVELTTEQQAILAGIIDDHSQCSVELEFLLGHFEITRQEHDWLYANQIMMHMRSLGYTERDGAATYKIAQELKRLGVRKEHGRKGTEYLGIKIVALEKTDGEGNPFLCDKV